GVQGGVGDAEAVQGVLQGAGDLCGRLAVRSASVTGVLGRAGCLGGVGDFPGGGEGAAGWVGGGGGAGGRGGGVGAGAGGGGGAGRALVSSRSAGAYGRGML